ncbi:MAG: pilus assembly protein PilM [Nitrospinae bacterium]|nr:pilus assembly protein PilM [Nitrospinota bacterium]
MNNNPHLLYGIQGLAARFNFPLVNSHTGIVIGSGRLCLIDLKRGGGGFYLNVLADVPLEGQNPFSPDVSRLLTRLARENSLHGRTAAILAAGRGLRVRILEMPRMEQGELVASLRFTEAEALPYPMETAALDGCILPGGAEGRMPVLMAALECAEADRHHQMLSRSPFRPIALTVVPAALDALLEHSRIIDTSVPVSFISISGAHIGVYIFEGGGIRFTRDIGFGGDGFTDALTGAYEAEGGGIAVSREEAETLVAFFGIPRGDSLGAHGPRGISGETVLARLQPALDKMVTELGRSLDYYRNEYQHSSVPPAYLIGSAVRIKNLAEYLTDALGCRFSVYNPFGDFIAAEGPGLAAARDNGAACAVAVGVALDQGRRINLLPEKKRWSPRNWLRARLPAAAAACYCLLVLGAGLAGTAYRKSLDAQIAEVEGKIAVLKRAHDAGAVIEAKMADIRGEIGAIDARKAAYPELEGRGIGWKELYGEVGRLMPDDMALDRLIFRFGNTKEYAADGVMYGRQALFEGRVRGGAGGQVKTLEQFLEKMRDSAFFTHATLISSREVAADGGNAYLKFTLAADIRREQL